MFKKTLLTLGFLGLAIPCLAADNPSLVPAVSSIAALQALGVASSQYPNVIVTGTQGNGSTFTWVSGSLPCNSSTGGGDTGTTFCAGTSGSYVTTGYWKRQFTASQGIQVNWFNGIDPTGATDSSTGFANVVTAASALSIANGFTPILGAPSAKYTLCSGFGTIDSYKTGIWGQGSYWSLPVTLSSNACFSNSGTGMTATSSSGTPYNPRKFLSDITIVGPSGGSAGTTGIGVLFSGGSGATAHITLDNVGIAGFHLGAQIGPNNAYLINFHHSSIYQNDDGISIPAGGGNAGENISIDGGSALFNNTRYAINSQNPNADWHVVDSSIDYNQVAGTATNAQVFDTDSVGSISNSHIEDFTHPVEQCQTSASTPQISLSDNTYVRANGASSHLIDAGNSCSVSVSGGQILAANSPQTLVGASSGGFISVIGLGLGPAAFDTSNGSYFFCAVGNISCSTNRVFSSSQSTTSTFFYAPNGYNVSALPSGFVGEFTYVKDANATCTKNNTPTGGGSTFCPVWYNGTAWVEY